VAQGALLRCLSPGSLSSGLPLRGDPLLRIPPHEALTDRERRGGADPYPDAAVFGIENVDYLRGLIFYYFGTCEIHAQARLIETLPQDVENVVHDAHAELFDAIRSDRLSRPCRSRPRRPFPRR